MPEFTAQRLKYIPGEEHTYLLSGVFRPFEALGVEGVARLLQHNLDFQLTERGSLATNSALPPLQPVRRLNQEALGQVVIEEVKVELWVKDDGSQPRFFMLQPAFVPVQFPGHPHPGGAIRPLEPEKGIQSACNYENHLIQWNPVEDPLIFPLAWSATWVAAHLIWEKTGEWLSLEVNHDYWKLWKQYGHTDAPCVCGSNRKFRECCHILWFCMQAQDRLIAKAASNQFVSIGYRKPA